MKKIKLIGITKRFPGVIANDKINLEINVGEILAVLGENGAGKSTLMNIIAGLYVPDEGEIYIDDQKVNFTSPRDAQKYGIVMIAQTPKLVNSFTVLENLVLGLKEAGIIYPTKKIRKKAEELIRKYDLSVDLDARVWTLSASLKKRVEILKALLKNAKVLILDEPTTALSPIEKDKLFDLLIRMKEEGCAVIIITHKLAEALQISDRIAVLRRGKLVGVVDRKEANESILLSMMFGKKRESLNGKIKTVRKIGDTLLELKDIYVKDHEGNFVLKGLNLKIHEGEILGIAGIAGNGQKELIEVLIGVKKIDSGEIFFRVNGKMDSIKRMGPRKRLDMGFAIIPEDRIKQGIAPSLSVAENLIIRYYYKKPFSDGIFIDKEYLIEWSKEMIEEFGIVTPDPMKPVKLLSGGNIQRLIIARELSAQRKIIIAAYPTFGLDIASAKFVRENLIKQKEIGAGIILISEDLDELLELSDRIAVIYEGEILGVFNANNANVETIAKLMIGVRN